MEEGSDDEADFGTRQAASEEKLLGKRAGGAAKHEANATKKQRVTDNGDQTDSANSKLADEESSYSQIDEDSYHNLKEAAVDANQGSN